MLRERRFRRRWWKTITALGLVVALGMSHALMLPAITMEDKTYCGYEQHIEHDESCYTATTALVCTLSEEGHTHTEECYQEQTFLSCGLEEADGHIHAEECLDESGELICGLADGEGVHHHDEFCFVTEAVLLCGQEESEPHVHGDDCYAVRTELTCTRPLHEHSLQCYSDPEADVESWDIWERTMYGAELTGNWSEDVIAIAQTQVGYWESEANYLVAEDGTTKQGYTRYGAWYGDPYGDWSAMFCSFCMSYAQVPSYVVPYNDDCQNWIIDLAYAGLYHPKDSGYRAEAGDLIFFDYDGDGEADHVGFVYEINENTIRTIEGNKADQVKYDAYSAEDACVIGYGELPENPNLPDEEEKTVTATAEDGATVTVTGKLPEDAEVTIKPVILTEDEVAAYLGKSSSVSVQSYVVYDITIWSNGIEWQPDDTVSVTITKPDIEIGEDDRFAVTHVDDEGNMADVTADLNEDGSIEITSDGFSLYIIYTYTVDFHYGDLSYSIQGTSSILLSELFDVLGIDIALSEVEGVTFSDDSLIRIEKIVSAEYERDWNLISLYPFDTTEELIVALKDGQAISILVTDASGGSNPLPVTESPDYVGTYPTGSGSTEWQITAQQYAGRTQSQKIPVDSDGDGVTDVYLQKNVVPTATENEFLVYLSVDKQSTWEEFLNDSRVAITTSNSYANDRPGKVYQSIHGNVTAEISEHNNQGTYSNQYYILFNVWQDHNSAEPLYQYYDWRWGNTSNCSNATAFLRVPGLGYIVVAKNVNLHVSGNGTGNPFVLDIYLSDGLQSALTFYDTVFTSVEDDLGDNIEFMEIIASDGSAAYNSETNSITWTPEDWQTVIPDFNYPPLSGWMENVVQMVYKVRLNTESDGFIGCADTINDKAASIAAGESNPVNTSAVLTFDKIPLQLTNGIPEVRGLEAEFPVPEVRGLGYDISLVKQNQDGEPLAGAIFGLYESDGTTPVTVDDEPLTFTTESNGTGRFTGLPFGDYVVKEVKASPGYYLASPNWWRVHMCYTDAPGVLEPDEAPFDHNMRFTGNDVGGQWIVVNPEDPINIPELPDVPEPPKWVPDLEPPLTKQIDYLGDNDGTTDFDNPDTTLDDGGVAGLEDLYRLYLNLQGDSTGVDLLLVIDNSNSMYTNYDMEGGETRAKALNDFLNGDSGNGFIYDFLGANSDNNIAAVCFGTYADEEDSYILPWTNDKDSRIPLTQDTTGSNGSTNYVAGLWLADKVLQEPVIHGTGNQKLVIFLGDGAVQIAHYDGVMRNRSLEGTAIHANESYIIPLARAFETFLNCIKNNGKYPNGVQQIPDNGDYYRIYNTSASDEYNERFFSSFSLDRYSIYTNTAYDGQTTDKSAVYWNLRDLNLNIPGFTNYVGITDQAAFDDFYQDWQDVKRNPEAGTAFIQNCAGATIGSTRTYDIYELTEISFLNFISNNPDTVVHSIAFSGDAAKEFIDETGRLRNRDGVNEVLNFFARYGRGEYHPAVTAQALAEEIYSICFMTNTEMTDTLSAYVQAAEAPELKVVQKAVDGSSEVVLYENGALTETGMGILESVDLDRATGKITVTFLPTYPVNPEYIYSASFNVQLTPEAYTQYVTDGGTYPHIGDPDTDYEANDTSAGHPGYFSNAGGKVTWTAGGSPDEEDFPKPVVQVPESRLYELPNTGGAGTLLYTLSGIMLMSPALMYGFSSRRRRERRSK